MHTPNNQEVFFTFQDFVFNFYNVFKQIQLISCSDYSISYFMFRSIPCTRYFELIFANFGVYCFDLNSIIHLSFHYLFSLISCFFSAFSIQFTLNDFLCHCFFLHSVVNFHYSLTLLGSRNFYIFSCMFLKTRVLKLTRHY